MKESEREPMKIKGTDVKQEITYAILASVDMKTLFIIGKYLNKMLKSIL